MLRGGFQGILLSLKVLFGLTIASLLLFLVLLASSGCDLQPALAHAAQCLVGGMRVSTCSKRRLATSTLKFFLHMRVLLRWRLRRVVSYSTHHTKPVEPR